MGVCGLQLGRLVCSYDMDHDDHEIPCCGNFRADYYDVVSSGLTPCDFHS